jgi:hypothetical protein
MEQLDNNAHIRLRERAFTIWEEAGGNVSEGYSLWHKLRPMLSAQNQSSTAQSLPKHTLAKPGGGKAD